MELGSQCVARRFHQFAHNRMDDNGDLANSRLAKSVIPFVGLYDGFITVNGNANGAVWVKAVSAGRGRD